MNILCLSCDVTKDLLTPYLDEICSEESKMLVENHLKDCADCRAFLEKLHAQDLGKDAPKVACLKKTKRTIKRWSVAAVTASLFLFFFGLLYASLELGMSFLGNYYLIMPAMMLLFHFAVSRGCQIARPEKGKWLFPIGGILIPLLAVTLWLLGFAFVTERILCPIPLPKLGPVLHDCNLALAVAAILLLAGATNLSHKEQKFFPVSQNLACFGLHLAMALDLLLFSMHDPESYWNISLRILEILTAEFVIVTAVLFLEKRLHAQKSLGNSLQ